MKICYKLILMTTFLISCQAIDKSELSQEFAEQERRYGFCQSSSSSSQVWNRAEIERQLYDLISNSKVKDSIKEAYPNGYITMTGERDKERCGEGRLVSNNEYSNFINHYLADIMTRYLHKITLDCSESHSLVQGDLGICSLQKKFDDSKKLDSVSAFLESTSVYISSHIALSLAAVALDDQFWASFPDTNVHASQDSTKTINARLKYIEEYKPVYDGFNEFLAENLSTVTAALSKECLVKGDFLNLAANIGQSVPFGASLFGNIRDKAFYEAIDLAKSFSSGPDAHPMITESNGTHYVDFERYDYGYSYPNSLRKLEEFSRDAMINPLSRAIYDNLLGGMTSEEIAEFRKTCR